MTKLAARGREAAASLLVPSIALLFLALALLAIALFPASGLAAEEGEGPPPGPELSFPQAPLDFGKTTVGTESTTVTVTVHNAGSVPAAIEKVTVEGADSGDFKLNGSSCGWLEPGQDCSAWISFAPGSPGAKQTTMAVALKELPSQTMPLSGTAVEPQLAFTPGSYDFGIQSTNESRSTNFQLTNTGEAFAYVGSTGIGGPDSGNFWINSGDCWNGRRLDPGESCGLQVNFNAWDAVHYEAQVQAYVSGSTFSADLSGTGGRAMLEPDASPVDFGAATAGTDGVVKTIVLTNRGNIPGAFFIAVVAGGDAGSFRLLDESCSGAPVAPNASCTVHVRFTPQGAGAKLARLALFGDSDGGTMVMLSGEGVAPAVTLAPSSHDFGELAAGERSAAHSFAVRNEGSTPLDLESVAIAGADSDQFTLAGDECSGATLAPGAECVVRVRFAPDGSGAKAATLRVRGAAGAFVATLAGSGTAAAEARADGPGATALPWGAPPYLRGHRVRPHRFSRGDAVAGRRGRALRRAGLHARTIPR